LSDRIAARATASVCPELVRQSIRKLKGRAVCGAPYSFENLTAIATAATPKKMVSAACKMERTERLGLPCNLFMSIRDARATD